MIDISKCRGDNCAVKHLCHRYTAPSSEFQSWANFHTTTRIANGGCIYFKTNVGKEKNEKPD